MTYSMPVRQLAAAVLAALLVASVVRVAAQGGEHFTATATMKADTTSHHAPVSFQIDHFVSDADRDKFMAVVKRHKTTEIHDALAKMPDLGGIETGGTKT